MASFADRARAWADGVLDDLRESDRYFKMRASVVGVWCLLAAITLYGACPGSGAKNSLGAEVRAIGDAFIGGSQVMVRNDSDELWTDVVLLLNGEWRYEKRTIRPKDEVVLSVTQFKRGADAAPPSLKVKTVDIRCEQGSAKMEPQ
jgi:hypothetical protein